jgi:alpha-galactosidase
MLSSHWILVAMVANVNSTELSHADKPLPYPPMHWHSWNTFCKENAVNETNMKEMADALISTGMTDAGYDTVNVVCNGWTGRDPITHELTENATLWPNGIRALADYLHAKSLKLGCYTSPATTNCCGEPGSLGYEAIDMETFAKRGCDHVMVDWCRGYVSPAQTKAEYEVIGQAIASSSNPSMAYGIWAGGMGKSWKWAAGVGGQYWRVSRDIRMYGSPQLTWEEGVLFNFDTAYRYLHKWRCHEELPLPPPPP